MRRKGYAQLWRAGVDFARKIDERDRAGLQKQTALGAAADICSEIDRTQWSAQGRVRFWANRWGWHPQKASRFLTGLCKNAGFVWLDDEIFPPCIGLVLVMMGVSLCVTKKCRHRDGEMTWQSSPNHGLSPICQRNGREVRQGCDSCVGDVTLQPSKAGGSCTDGDSAVTSTFNTISSISTTTLNPCCATAEDLEIGGEEVGQYIQAAVSRPETRNPKELTIHLRKRIVAQGCRLTERDRSQLVAWQREEFRATEANRIAEAEIRRTRKMIDSSFSGEE